MRVGGVDGFPLTIDLGGGEFDGFRLELDGRGYLQFNEFEAWTGSGADAVNVALRRPVRQSSSPVKGHGPRGGNSGRVHADIGSITDFEDGAWWQVDLDGPHPIARVNLFNRLVHNVAGLDRVRVLGRRDGSWVCVFDNLNETDVAGVLQGRLRVDHARIESVLAHAMTPQLSRAGTTDTEIGKEVLPGWHEARQLDLIGGISNNLAECIARMGTAVPLERLHLVRTAANLALPSTLPSHTAHTRIVATSELERLSLHTFDGCDDRPVRSVRLCDTPLDRAHPVATASLADDHWTPRMQMVDEWDTPGDAYFIDLDGISCQHAKWELWGSQSGGASVLVYDSLALSSSILALIQIVRRLGLDDFETLDSILAGLELERRTASAIATSRWFEVEDPGPDRFARSLQEIELRSAIDEARKPVTRTKHGYKTTHRFMDPTRYAAGTKRLLELVAQHELFRFVFPAFGTLLGFIRSDGFIPHDDDADLVVVTEAQSRDEMMELRDVLREHLSQYGDLKLFDGSKLPGRNLPVGFTQGGQWVHIDLFLTYYDDGQLMLFNDRLKTFEPIDPVLMSLGRSVTIHDVGFDVPVQSEELLEFWYGPQWRTPIASYLLGYSWQS